MSAETLAQGIPYPHNKSLSFSARVFSSVLASSDAICALASGTTLYISYLGWHSTTYPTYVGASALGALLLTSALNHAGFHTPHLGNDFLRHVKGIVSIWIGVFFALILAAYVLKISSNVSRVWSFAWFGSVMLLLVAQRILLWKLILRAALLGKLTQRTVILGGGDPGKRLLKHLEQWAEPWVKVVGVFDDRIARIGPSIRDYPLMGNLEDLLQFVSEQRVDNVLIALPWTAEQRLWQIIERLRELSVDVYFAPDGVGLIDSELKFRFIARTPMLGVVSKPINGWDRLLKEAEDRLIALPLLLLLMPTILLIAVAIKLNSEGPVFFRQERRGLNKKTFEILKFRTMYHKRCLENDFRQAQQNDLRVTRVGRFLRRTSLDELPQLFNVLKGDMSLIGPRPHPVWLDEEHAARIEGYFARNRVKPGITGWAQVNGFRGETRTPHKMKMRIAHDIYYIENWSLLFDIRILFMTVFVGFIHKNAY